MFVRLETLILPVEKRVSNVKPAVLVKEKRREVDRTLLASLDGYSAIKRELFEPYREPVLVADGSPPDQAGQEQLATGGQADRVQADPPADSDMVPRAIVSSPRSQEVVLEDVRTKNAEDKRIEVGEPMFGGTLVFVDPRGAVTEGKDGTRRFHRIGEPLKQGQVLTEEQHPMVYHELMKLEQRSAGISMK